MTQFFTSKHWHGLRFAAFTLVGLSLLITPALAFAQPAAPSTYKVQADDSLAVIAVRLYGDMSFVKAIRRANPGLSLNHIVPGQLLTLPSGPVLSAKQGDEALLTMWRLRLQSVREPASITPTEAPVAAVAAFQPQTPKASGSSQVLAQSEAPKQQAEVSLAKHDDASALKIFQDLSKRMPTDVYSRLQVIQIQKRLGKTEEAKRLAEKFVLDFPSLERLPVMQDLLSKAGADGRP